MTDRLRAFLDHPLDPSAARAILVLASAVLLGVAALFVVAASEPERSSRESRSSAPSPAPALLGEIEDERIERHRPTGQQDPQDVPGSAAAQRAARALRSHRALQHVPYRDGEVTVSLAGARGSRAVLRVSASTVREAHRGWHRFLRRYGDSGKSYIPVFAAARQEAGRAADHEATHPAAPEAMPRASVRGVSRHRVNDSAVSEILRSQRHPGVRS